MKIKDMYERREVDFAWYPIDGGGFAAKAPGGLPGSTWAEVYPLEVGAPYGPGVWITYWHGLSNGASVLELGLSGTVEEAQWAAEDMIDKAVTPS